MTTNQVSQADRVEEIHGAVRERYAAAARRAAGTANGPGSGCAPGDGAATWLYGADERAELPQAAVAGSLGCGNPVALAELSRGEVVLDLGSGGGIDVLLAAKRVGPEGFVYGVDMTDEMLELAERNRARSGLANARFLKGEIEELPLADSSVDVVISNCVVNLSPDKDRVLREAYRVLKPGGRVAIADIAALGPVPAAVRASVESWVGCVGGTLDAGDYVDKIAAAGFEGAGLEVLHTFGRSDLDLVVSTPGAAEAIDQIGEGGVAALDGQFASVLVRGRKPA